MMHATIIGYLGKDATWTDDDKGGSGYFSIAVTQKKKAGEFTTWVTVWHKNKNLSPFLKKGQQVVVAGELMFWHERYQDKDKVTANLNTRSGYIKLVGPKKEDAPVENPFVQSPPAQPQPVQPQGQPPTGPYLPAAKDMTGVPNSHDDDLPF